MIEIFGGGILFTPSPDGPSRRQFDLQAILMKNIRHYHDYRKVEGLFKKHKYPLCLFKNFYKFSHWFKFRHTLFKLNYTNNPYRIRRVFEELAHVYHIVPLTPFLGYKTLDPSDY